MGKTMNSNFAAFLAMTAMFSATACGQKSSDTDTSENAVQETTAPETSSYESESVGDFHRYSTGGLRLDCTVGFEQLKADAIAMENMEMVEETDEQIAYITPEAVSFTMTKEPHPAHPMIVRRDVVVGDGEVVASGDEIRIDMAACGFGTKEASDRVMDGFALLNERFMLQQKIRLEDQ